MEFVFNPFVLNTYDDIKPYLDDLVNREVKNKEETTQWIEDYNALQANIEEDFNRRYIHQTCYTENEDYKQAYIYFINEISPKLDEVNDLLRKKIVSLPGIEELEKNDEAYAIWLRTIRKWIERFRPENIPLKIEIANKQRIYGEITGAMTIEHDGKTLTLPLANKYVDGPDRAVRKEVYEKIQKRKGEDKEKLDNLLNELIVLRNTMAKNAGYESFVEYQWEHYSRFDYTQQDVFNFHEGIRMHIVPLVTKIFERKKKELGVDRMTPYDVGAVKEGEEALKPFTTGEELIEKATKTMGRVHPQFAANLQEMKEKNFFDLDSRKGKKPGGYNLPMPISRRPFIFMNSAGSYYDVIVFLHEAGHAMHSFYAQDVKNIFNDYPMEIAEVASMSMELMGLNSLDEFYKNPEDLKRAKLYAIEDRTLVILTWIPVIDSFQYWLYKNPDHTVEERDSKFKEILSVYQPWIDYSGYEDVMGRKWQGQLHIYECPFYYIEYGIAQLGAYGVWKNFIENPTSAVEKYTKALSLGYTKKLPTLFETAGIPFDFSPARIKELADFVWSEREKIAQ